MLWAHMNLIRWLQNTIIQEMPSSYELALPEHIAIMNAVCDRDPPSGQRGPCGSTSRIHEPGSKDSSLPTRAHPVHEGQTMKIKSITSHILRVPLGDKAFYSSQAAFPSETAISSGSKRIQALSVGARVVSTGHQNRSRPVSMLSWHFVFLVATQLSRYVFGRTLCLLPGLRAEGNVCRSDICD